MLTATKVIQKTSGADVQLGTFALQFTARQGETICVAGIEYTINHVLYDLTNDRLEVHVRCSH